MFSIPLRSGFVLSANCQLKHCSLWSTAIQTTMTDKTFSITFVSMRKNNLGVPTATTSAQGRLLLNFVCTDVPYLGAALAAASVLLCVKSVTFSALGALSDFFALTAKAKCSKTHLSHLLHFFCFRVTSPTVSSHLKSKVSAETNQINFLTFKEKQPFVELRRGSKQ